MKLFECKLAYEVFNKISGETPKDGDMSLTFKLAKFLKKFDETISIYEDCLHKIELSFADKIEKNEDGSPKLYEGNCCKVLPQYLNEYNKANFDLAMTEIDDIVPTLSYSALVKNFTLTADDWKAILPFIIDDSEV